MPHWSKPHDDYFIVEQVLEEIQALIREATGKE
jgi:hypothetical protein